MKNKEVAMNGEIIYLWLLAVNAIKEVPLERVMAFKNAPVPTSLFTKDGSKHSGDNAEFMHQLQELLPQHLQRLKTIKGEYLDKHTRKHTIPTQRII